MEAINIWSGSNHSIGAVLTNPTELAFKKGKLKHHYPVEYLGITYADAEAAYQAHKTNDLSEDMVTMILIISIKLYRYPQIVEAIDRAGGEKWLKSCSHHITGKSRWEGNGMESKFIVCLVRAYQLLKLH